MKKAKTIKQFMDYLLKEDNDVPQPQSAYETRPVEKPKDVSLDQVVDRYIVRYEKESIPTVSNYEGDMFENKIPSYSELLREVLNEADDDPTEPDSTAADDPGGSSTSSGSDFGDDLNSTTSIGGGGTANKEAEQNKAIINTPQINLQEFSKNIARLVNNFETLLNPKDIILNRVENYIKTNYDERTAQELMEMLDSNFSLRTPEKSQKTEDDFPTPYAAGALSTEG